jgi:hypothetical protein
MNFGVGLENRHAKHKSASSRQRWDNFPIRDVPFASTYRQSGYSGDSRAYLYWTKPPRASAYSVFFDPQVPSNSRSFWKILLLLFLLGIFEYLNRCKILFRSKFSFIQLSIFPASRQISAQIARIPANLRTFPLLPTQNERYKDDMLDTTPIALICLTALILLVGMAALTQIALKKRYVSQYP